MEHSRSLPRILCSATFVDTFTARLAYKKLIRMNMPVDEEGKVNFTTTLFALIRENLSIKMRSAEEMDQVSSHWRRPGHVSPILRSDWSRRTWSCGRRS